MPICAFCGKTVDKVTADHIPPRGIFGEKPDYQLITVPSCGKCNWGTSKDDEYFKLLAVEKDASQTPVAESVIDSTVRAMSRKDRPAFGHMVRSKMSFGNVVTEGGIHLGPNHIIKLDQGRILKTVGKTVRGLFFHINERPLPEHYGVWCRLIPDARKLFLENATASEEFEGLLEAMKEKMLVTVGPNVFAYKYGEDHQDPNTTYFLLRFYEQFDFFGYTFLKKEFPASE